MAEASRTDESLRRDRVVDAQIQTTKRAQWIQPAILFTCLGCAALSLWVFHEPLGTVFLSGPIIQAVSGPVQSLVREASQRRRSQED